MLQQITDKSKAKVTRAESIAIIYETPAIREHAVRFCERLAEKQKSPGLEMNWWSFQVLGHPALRTDAVEKAACADVVVFAMNAGGDLPEEIKWWIEHWLNKRGEREGALVGLLQREEPRDIASFREIYLRHAARRAGMDYLSHAAPTAGRAIPNSLDSFSERAGRMTSVLANILHKHPHSPPRL
jgi:hypothetical protein